MQSSPFAAARDPHHLLGRLCAGVLVLARDQPAVQDHEVGKDVRNRTPATFFTIVKYSTVTAHAGFVKLFLRTSRYLDKGVPAQHTGAMRGQANKKKIRKTGPKATSGGGKRNRKTPTRERILEAAKRVFAEHPYSTASIRMVGNAAGLDHPLISYYFPTKADLFEAVLEEIAETYYEANTSWFEGLETLRASKGFPLYIDRLLDFTSKHPEALRIIALNLVQPQDEEIIPGYKRIQALLLSNAETFRKVATLRSPAREIRMFTESFNTVVINYLGASTYYAGILGMNPRSPAYRRWVKEALLFLFLPPLKHLILGATRRA
jgi:AcrR family transcriptional regulator